MAGCAGRFPGKTGARLHRRVKKERVADGACSTRLVRGFHEEALRGKRVWLEWETGGSGVVRRPLRTGVDEGAGSPAERPPENRAELRAPAGSPSAERAAPPSFRVPAATSGGRRSRSPESRRGSRAERPAGERNIAARPRSQASAPPPQHASAAERRSAGAPERRSANACKNHEGDSLGF
jgi:hypothetical protein